MAREIYQAQLTALCLTSVPGEASDHRYASVPASVGQGPACMVSSSLCPCMDANISYQVTERTSLNQRGESLSWRGRAILNTF